MKALVLMVVLGLASGCATVVTDDYKGYLANNQGQLFPGLDYDAQYVITPATKSHTMQIKSGMAGYANSWEVRFGPLLEATLQSPDVQAAFKSFKESAGPVKGTREITFNLIGYDFSDHRAKINISIGVDKDGKKILEKAYQAEGNSQGGKMFWGGGMAMKNAVQQSTKSAMDAIMRKFLTDLKELK
jgi:hypothetical protein